MLPESTGAFLIYSGQESSLDEIGTLVMDIMNDFDLYMRRTDK